MIVTGLLYSCTASTDPSSAETESGAKARADANIEIVKAFVEAFNSGEFEKWRELCSEDFVTYGPGIDDEATLEEYIASMSGMNEIIDSLRSESLVIGNYVIEEGDRKGDYVLWWGTNSGYFKDPGKSVKVRLHTVYKIEDGKIVWNSDYWDTGDLQEQLKADGEGKEEKPEGKEV